MKTDKSNANAHLRVRLIRTEYGGSAGDRQGHAVSIEGALRAAVLRVATGQYKTAMIYDDRFAPAGVPTTLPAVRVSFVPATRSPATQGGVSIRWAEAPKWAPPKAKAKASKKETRK